MKPSIPGDFYNNWLAGGRRETMAVLLEKKQHFINGFDWNNIFSFLFSLSVQNRDEENGDSQS